MSFKHLPDPSSPAPSGASAAGAGSRSVEEEWGAGVSGGGHAGAEPDDGASPSATEAVPAPAPAKGNRLAPLVVSQGDGGRGRPLRFVVVLLVAAALLVVVVAGFNAYVDPYGTVGTAALPPVTWTDRSLKVNLIDHLHTAPKVIILGSSRAMKIQPSYITRRTGLPAFNAAVSSGKPIDTWTFVNYIHSRFPAAHSQYLWLLDVESFRDLPVDPGLLNTPQLAQYLGAGQRLATRFDQLPLLFSWHTFFQSWHSLWHQIDQPPSALRTSIGNTDFAPDGFRIRDYHDVQLAGGATLASELRKTIRQVVPVYRDDYRRLSATAESDFERTLAFMNSLGATPVIVISPVHPALLAAISGLGYTARYQDVLRYLKKLQGRYHFHLLDFSHVSSFGGRPADFYDGYHMTVPNTRRLVNAVLTRLPHDLR